MIRSQITTGLYLQAISTLFAACMTTLVKLLTTHIPIFEAVLSRSLVLVLVSGFLCRYTHVDITKSQHRLLLFFRGLFGFLAVSSLYASVQYMPLADAAALGFLSPIFITIASPIVLSEPISTRVYVSLPIAFLGVLFIAQPSMLFGSHSDHPLPLPGLIFGILQSIFGACARLTVRTLGKSGESIHLIVLSMAIMSVLGSLLCSIFLPSQHLVLPDQLYQYVCLVAIGLCALGVQFGQTAALQHAPVAYIAPLIYLVGVWSAVLDYFVFDVMPDVLTIVGVLLVVSGSLFILTENSSSGNDGNSGYNGNITDTTHSSSDVESRPLLNDSNDNTQDTELTIRGMKRKNGNASL